MDEKYEYRVGHHRDGKPETVTRVTENPKEAGEQYRNTRKLAFPGDNVSLQRRPVGKWEIVESEKQG